MSYYPIFPEEVLIIRMSQIKGEKKGEIKGRKEVALNLLSAGLLDIESIASVTGLDAEEIKRLQAEAKIKS